MTPKAFDTLVALVERAGRVVTRDELFQLVWPDAIVEEGTLAQNVFTLRRALGDDTRYIETVPKIGYRFIEPVAREDAASTAVPGERRRARWPVRVAALAAAAALLAGALLSWWPSRRASLGASTPRVVAVLPFRAIPQDQLNEILGLGMADALIAKLGGVGQLVVRSTAAVAKYVDADPITAGRDLRADAVLEGSVQRIDNRVRVRARLLGTTDGRPLWTGQFDEAATDLLALQDSLSEQIARALVAGLSPSEREHLALQPTSSPAAYEAYARGRFFWNKRTADGLLRSLEYFEQAIALDGRYARAYAGIANTCVLLNFYGGDPNGTAWPRAKEAAERAIALAPELADAHTALAHVKYSYEWGWPGAEREFRRALEIDSNDATAHQWFAEYLALLGRTPEATREIERALELDPQSVIINAERGTPYAQARQCARAEELLRKALEMDPEFPATLYYLARCYQQDRRYDDAIALYRRLEAKFGGSAVVTGSLAHVYAVSGRRQDSERVLSEMLAASRQRADWNYMIATVYAGLGDADRAFEWIDRAILGRDDQLVLLKVDTHLDSLRGDRRFRDAMHRVGIP